MNLHDKLAVPSRPKVAPVEYAGQWIAWNKDETAVIAHGPNVAQVRAAANAAGESDPLLEKVHHPNRIHVGQI